jgi:protease-4
MAESLARDAYEQVVEAIALARGRPAEAIRAVIDQGPFLADEALRLGLVDGLAYEDQIDDRVRVGAAGLQGVELDTYQGLELPSLWLRRRARIALVYADGTLDLGASGVGPEGAVVGADTLTRAIRAARADDSIRAIVLRVDSPGGSSVASDIVWRELMLTRRRKPLVVSMSDLAASGGYYIALPAQTIVAQPGTLTGSIGVFGGKFVVRGVLDKLGAKAESVELGRHAGMQSPLRPYTPDERALYERQIDAFYRQFVQKVADARHSTFERVDAIAQGRVWTGRQALALGLVDELGGLDRAIAVATTRAKIDPGTPIEIVEMPDRRGLYELVGRSWGALRAVTPIGGDLWTIDARAVRGVASRARLFERGEPLALMPFVW